MKRKMAMILSISCTIVMAGSSSPVMAQEYSAADEIPITVFFDEGATREQIDRVEELIRERKEVKEILYVSSEQAWEELKDSYFQGSDVEEGFQDENPLSGSSHFKIYTEQLQDQPELAEYIENLDYVREVNCAYAIE